MTKTIDKNTSKEEFDKLLKSFDSSKKNDLSKYSGTLRKDIDPKK